LELRSSLHKKPSKKKSLMFKYSNLVDPMEQEAVNFWGWFVRRWFEDPRVISLTPKGMGLPYVGFSDSGQAAVNAFYF
jgi:hypothetical protein